MQHLYYWLGKLRRFLWISSLVFIITLALMLTLARQLLPYASEYKADIEAQMSEVFKRPVKVGAVDARLQNFYPTLVLKDVEIIDEASKKTLFSFHEVYAGLSVIKSVRMKQPVFVNLGLNGSSIALRRNKQGEVSIKGLDISLAGKNKATDTEESIRRTLGWLFTQRSLEVKNVSVYIQDEMYGREYFLPYVNALFRNLINRHQVDANIMLDPADGKEIVLAMDLRGKADDVENIKGDVYLSASQLKIGNWLGDFQQNNVSIAGGAIDVRLWSKWRWLDLQQLDAVLAVNNGRLDWKEQQDIIQLNQLNTRVTFEKQQQGWQLDFSETTGQINSKNIAPNRTRVTKLSNEKYRVESSAVKLDDLAGIAERLPWLDKGQKENLLHLQPQGEVDRLYLTYEPGKDNSINASFELRDFGIESYKKIPLLRGVSGLVWLDNHGGTFQLNTHNMRFHQKHAYREPWDFRLMQGRVDWQLMGDGLHIISERLEAHTSEMRAENRFHLVVPNNNAPPFMDMYSRFESDDLSQVPRYYPVNKIKPDLLKWLDKAFVAGKAYNGHMVHYGRVKKGYFPFRKNRGNFAVSFKTDNAIIDYQDGWPKISQLDADVLFAGSSMRLRTKSAVLSKGMHIRNLEVSIADFKYPKVRLGGNVKGTTQPAINFVMHSPLKESMGSALKYVEGRGDVYLKLAMQIPLQKDTKEITTYQGKLSFVDNNLKINFDDGYLDADRFNGELTFDERQYQARNIQAMVLGHPVNMDVNTYFQGERSSIVVSGKGRANSKTMARQTRVWLFDYLYGDSNYEFSAVINNKNNYYDSSYLRLTSDTRGIHMNMPAPVYKESYQPRDLKVRWNIDQNLVNVQWGDSLETSMAFAPEEQGGYMNRLALTMGKDEHQLPQQESILITGQLDNFSIKEWSTVLNKELSSPDKMDKILPLHIKMKRLAITDFNYQIDKTGKVSKQVDLERVPNLLLEIDSLRYREKEYGRLLVELQSQSDRFQVKQLQLQHPLLNFKAQGEWVLGRQPHTRMTMDMQSKNVGQLLKMFGFSATMTGELRANANLQWEDELYNFKMEELEGNLDFTINQGAFQDIEPGVGRVMGLFSFQALPRRLALDFSDFFSTGYHFDQIKGGFIFDNGEAKSEKITIQAPSSRVVMSGTTSLIRKTYDYDVIIIPGDGSNLFMAGLLAGGLQTGFVVWAIDRMVRVDKYTRMIYHLGGTWDKPVIKNLTETKAK